MKKLFMAISIALVSLTASAQVYVGGEVGLWRNDNADRTSFSLVPEVGYNLSDKWALGLQIGYGHISVDDVSANGFTVSPYVRWSALEFGPVTLFLDGGFGFNTYKVEESDGQNGWQIGVQPGVKVALHKNIDFVAHAGFLGYRDSDDGRVAFGEDGFGFKLSSQDLTFGLLFNF